MILRFVFLLLAVAGAASAATILHCRKFVDVANLSVRENVSITVDGDRIQRVSDGFAPGEAIDLKSHTCMPGLMDMHVHLSGAKRGDCPPRGTPRGTMRGCEKRVEGR